MTEHRLAESVIVCLKKKAMTLSAAESCTGGLLSSFFTEISGSSAVIRGGAVTYCNEMKHKLLGVKNETLDTCGAVSSQCAMEMAAGVRLTCESDIGISVTGIAGPNSDETGAPVGLVFIGIADSSSCRSLRFLFPGSRQEVRLAACREAMKLLLTALDAPIQEALS